MELKNPRAAATPRTLWTDLLVTLPFLLFFYVQLVHHELWRDELNAFGISAGSDSLRVLLQNTRYEGHPWLWYWLLSLVARVTHAPVAMKWLEAAIGTAIYFVLGFLSPFRWWEKVLLFLSYYIGFEYTVLTRMYGVVLLLALLYVWRRLQASSGVVLNATLLGLLASADMTGILLSFALIAEYLYSLWRPGEFPAARPTRRAAVLGMCVYLLFLALAIASMWPQPDAGSKVNEGLLYGYTRHDWHLVRVVVSDIVIPYVPTLTGSRGIFWDTVFGDHPYLFTALLPPVALAYWLVLRRHANLLVLFGVDALLTISFGFLIYLGKPRHYGMTFLTFVLCLWMLKAGRKAVHPAAYALLGLSAVSGIHAMAAAWQRPFSNSEATARWLQRSGYTRLPLVGSQDYVVLGVAAVLQRPMYMLDCECTQSYLRFNAKRDQYTWNDLPERMPQARQALHADTMVLVAAHPIDAEHDEELGELHFRVQLLRAFLGSEIPEDNFYVYLVQTTEK